MLPAAPLLVAASLFLLPSFAVPAATFKLDPKRGCRTNPALVGPCFEIEGRAVATNGSPSMRIIRRGAKRVLGVLPAENEIAPACLRRHVSFEWDVAGRFTVCPFTRERPGAMQMVCVQQVTDAVVRPVDPKQPGAARKLPDCSLPEEGQ
jgi:hypothetical protein